MRVDLYDHLGYFVIGIPQFRGTYVVGIKLSVVLTLSEICHHGIIVRKYICW